MNLTLAMFAPIIQPVLQEVYSSVLLPELQKLDGQVSAADLKIVADALLAAIQTIVPAEISKL
jgi:hypothetical protein